MVDTSAILAIVLNEPDAETYLAKLSSDDQQVTISAPTLVEAQIVARARLGAAGSTAVEGLIADASVQVCDFTRDHAKLALDAWQRFGRGSGSPARLNFGDCFAYALAKAENASLLFKGNDFLRTDIEVAIPA